jgi:hypothetical protein
VKCPFFQNDDGRRRINCEGITDQSITAVIFRTRGGYGTQIRVFCCENYKKCEIYRMLMANKYDEEE